VLGLGFGLLQTINRPDPAPAPLAVAGQSDSPVIAADTASVAGPAPAPLFANPNSTTAAPAANAPREIHPREIQTSASLMQPTYTIQVGDTLGKIAAQFGTTADRIQALNNLADPRALRIGSKLVIPPPF